ncbi:hypothetical protein [Corynebacterium sp. MSK195]|uniref:hypothetical protein n=1 Tax=Corynebacterium sp. MSK195 TaxID=3050216 RepID=UPI002550B4FA|nr:hypothetical protein [Corynebacterium sp. MSK195]MDK8670244.1 hypothetical protein [Corynebacterium sp. MSK195]
MSLSPAEVQATSRELHALRDALPLADAPIEPALGYAPGGLHAALEIQSGPIKVWRKPARTVPRSRALAA